jgi:hypothetical protein
LGGLKLVRDVTRKTISSIEIHTTQPGVPMTGPQGPAGISAPTYTFFIQGGDLYVSY